MTGRGSLGQERQRQTRAATTPARPPRRFVPSAAGKCGPPMLQESVLRPLAFCEKRQCLARDERLEVIAGLVRRECGIIREKLVEEKLRGIVLAAADQEKLDAEGTQISF